MGMEKEAEEKKKTAGRVREALRAFSPVGWLVLLLVAVPGAFYLLALLSRGLSAVMFLGFLFLAASIPAVPAHFILVRFLARVFRIALDTKAATRLRGAALAVCYALALAALWRASLYYGGLFPMYEHFLAETRVLDFWGR